MSIRRTGRKTRNRRPHLVVFGSLNYDHLWQVPHLPRPGHTQLAIATRRAFGGKGANQAVAAARSGADVTLVGALGEEGTAYVQHLAREGIRLVTPPVVRGSTSGAAHVYVDATGENSIVVDAGANGSWDPAMVRRMLAPVLPGADFLLLQFEVPSTALDEALNLAALSGVRVLLNPSPVLPDYRWGAHPIECAVVNEHECAAYFGREPAGLLTWDGARRQALLAERALRCLIVTRGAEPTLCFEGAEVLELPAHPVQPVDTVGAGDTFSGYLAAGRAAGMSWAEAVARANVAAALATLLPGAQDAMPAAAQVVEAWSAACPEREGLTLQRKPSRDLARASVAGH